MIDVMSNDQYPDWLKEVDICVMCIEQKHPNFIKFCFQHHIHYIDISPSYESLSQVMVFDELAKKSQSSAVIGVGISPGLSNLLASQLSNEMDQVEQIDTYLMLGIGEVHGHDGVNWLLNHIQKNYTLMENGLEKQVKPFSDGKRSTFHHSIGKRTAYRFNLADQYILQQTADVTKTSSRFFYDSKLAMIGIVVAKKLGLSYLLRVAVMKRAYRMFLSLSLKLFEKLRIGTDLYTVKVEVSGEKQGKSVQYEASLTGNNNTKITGEVAAVVVDCLQSGKKQAGVYYLEQMMELDEILFLLDERANVTYMNHS
ncbi:hypothetical protein DH09_16775 [Bacillaceae bacterium JMAK1]|nr:hypothetical protein DH09_16775 [Bacillaceae bacterium JMAK1]